MPGGTGSTLIQEGTLRRFCHKSVNSTIPAIPVKRQSNRTQLSSTRGHAPAGFRFGWSNQLAPIFTGEGSIRGFGFPRKRE